MRRTKEGFTLVEVIVVLSIVMLLAGTAFALSAPMREKARQSVCASQLRQIHAAIMMYSADSDAGEEMKGLPGLSLQPYRRGYKCLLPYSVTRDILFCPNSPTALKAQKLSSSYAWDPVPPDLSPDASAGSRGADKEIAARIERLGSSFPLLTCGLHDETYYWPAESHISPF